jgi:hypothetical protein
MTNPKKIALACACMLASALAFAAGQSSANFAIPKDTINAGVGDMASPNFRLSSSVGDAVAGGKIASVSFQLSSGFRAQIIASPAVLNLLTVLSRKFHGATPFYVNVDRLAPITGNITVEPRAIGGGHTLIFHFDSAVTSVNAAATALDSVLASAGTATAQAIGGDVVVTLTNVADNKRLTITVNGLNGGAGSAQASLGFLVGDVSNTRAVNAADVSAVKANLNKPVTTDAIAKFDLNADGSITQADVSAVKARSGMVLAP